MNKDCTIPASGDGSPIKLAVVFVLFLSLILAGCLSEQAVPGDEFLHPPTKGPTATLYPAGEIDLAGKLDANGVVLQTLQIISPDRCLTVTVDAGIRILGEDGQPPAKLTIAQDYPGKLPMEAYGVSISYAYRFEPGELHFSQPVLVEFTCLKNYKQTMLPSISVGILGDAGEWDQWSVEGDRDSIWTRLQEILPARQYLLVGPAPMGS